MLNVLEFDLQKKYVDDFLLLPKLLYNKKNITQNEPEELKILNGTHILSESFKIHKFLLYNSAEPVGRFIITFYSGDEAAYLGFYECIDSSEAAKTLFDFAKDFSRSHGKKRIIGPYDASFWIKYRLKINRFGVPYTGEPYNREYYYGMFLDNGFTVLKHYVSNIFPRMPVKGDYSNRFDEYYKHYVNQGYEFKSPCGKDIDKMMGESYEMITELYKDFPGYKPISGKQFIELFSPLKYIADKRMLKTVYCKGEPVGFFITFPDYSNLLNKPKLGIKEYITILSKRKRSDNYIWMYLGVMQGNRGLGKALYSLMLSEQSKRKAAFTAALIKDGNANAGYLSEIVSDVSEYVLLKCEL